MRSFFNRENAFRMMLFSSMLIMALYHFFFNGEFVSQITSFLGFLTFILSVLSMVIMVLEKLIKNYDLEIETIRYFFEYCQVEDAWDVAENLLEFKKAELYNKIDELNCGESDKESFVKYWVLKTYRRNIRKIRRFFLYFYFATITLILVFLFLSHELLPYLKNMNFGEWTILSFVIILFEILIKDEISDGLYSFLNDLLIKKQKKYSAKSEDENNG